MSVTAANEAFVITFWRAKLVEPAMANERRHYEMLFQREHERCHSPASVMMLGDLDQN